METISSRLRRAGGVLIAASCLLAAGGAQGAQAVVRVSATASTLPATLRSLPRATQARIEGVRLPFGSRTATLELERFDVFTPDATVVIHGADGATSRPAPHPVQYRGSVEGEPGSIVFLTAPPGGPLEGFARTSGRTLRLSDAVDGALELRDELSGELAAARPFSCESPVLPPAAKPAAADASALGATPAASGSWYGVEVAVETDAELFALFGNVDDAVSYVAVLFGGAAAIYRADLDVNLVVNSISLWTGGTASDPWGSYANTCYYLAALGNYWHANHPMASLPRDTVHLLSGKSMWGGIAWLGVLTSSDYATSLDCNNDGVRETSTYYGGYGLVTSIAGNYHPTNTIPVWDVVAVAHEIGHNFNSPHTHCYNGIEYADPVDECYSGEQDSQSHLCYSGPTSVPVGGGSIMSYCHLLTGGFNNINLSFGAPGLYGVHSERVPERMRAHVDTVHAGLATTIFWDGFESDGMYFWSTATP